MKATDREAILKKIIDDTLWMAIRYAHGRPTYAPGIVRNAVKVIKTLYPDYKLKRDPVVRRPSIEDARGFMPKSIWLDDLFEE